MRYFWPNPGKIGSVSRKLSYTKDIDMAAHSLRAGFTKEGEAAENATSPFTHKAAAAYHDKMVDAARGRSETDYTNHAAAALAHRSAADNPVSETLNAWANSTSFRAHAHQFGDFRTC